MPTLVVHVPMAVRVPQDKICEGLSAAICTAAERVAVPAALREERLAADETSAILGSPQSQEPRFAGEVPSHQAPGARFTVGSPHRVRRVRCPCALEVACPRGLWCPIPAEGLDVTGRVTSLAGEHPWLRAGRWEVWLSHPSRTLLGGPASRPTPQPLREVPVPFPEGVGTGPLPVIVGPPAHARVEWWDHRTGPGLWLGVDGGSPLPQEGFDTLR